MSSRKRGEFWSEDNLRAAMNAVQRDQLSQRAAALRYNIPRWTLRDHLKTGKNDKRFGRNPIFTKQQERDLSERIKRFAKIGVPLTPKFIRKQAFLYCERYDIKNNFNKLKRTAGPHWMRQYLKRNPGVTKRKPQIMNPARAQKLNKVIVKEHFQSVKKIYDELDILQHPERLYNMDEKGCRITVHNQKTVLAERGSKRVHLIAPEHAENVTIAMCVSAVGTAIPPMILFKGQRHRPDLTENLPAGTLVRMAVKGSMTSDLFVEFIQHMGTHKVAGKCLLVFDGAKCHLSMEAVEEADKNDIVLYCLPSNTTHELQPLDKSVNKSYEHYWDEEVLNYLYTSADRTLTKATFNKIFSRIWPKCMTHSNIANGFKATGLFPFDPEAIPEEAFAPSILSEIPCPQVRQEPLQLQRRNSESTDTDEEQSVVANNNQNISERPLACQEPLQNLMSMSGDDDTDYTDDGQPVGEKGAKNKQRHLKEPPSAASNNEKMRLVEPPSVARNNEKMRLVEYSSSEDSDVENRKSVNSPSLIDDNVAGSCGSISAVPGCSNWSPQDTQKALSHNDLGIPDYALQRTINNNSDSDSDISDLGISSFINKPFISKYSAKDIYSYSSSECSADKGEITPQKQVTKAQQKLIYTNNSASSTSELDELDNMPGEFTPKKQITKCQQNLNLNISHYNGSSTSESSSDEDNIPLSSFKDDKKTHFHKLLPTPNYATIKVKSERPRKKAMNYKGQKITKDLFKDKDVKQNKSKANRNDTTKNKKKESNIVNENDKNMCNKQTKPQKKKLSKKINDKFDTKKKSLNNKNKTKKERSNIQEDTGTNYTEEWYCYACYENKKMDMRQCGCCNKWYHEECVGLSKSDKEFICPDC